MRPMLLLLLVCLAGCSQSTQPGPCIPPSYVDVTGECVSQPIIQHRR